MRVDFDFKTFEGDEDKPITLEISADVHLYRCPPDEQPEGEVDIICANQNIDGEIVNVVEKLNPYQIDKIEDMAYELALENELWH